MRASGCIEGDKRRSMVTLVTGQGQVQDKNSDIFTVVEILEAVIAKTNEVVTAKTSVMLIIPALPER